MFFTDTREIIPLEDGQLILATRAFDENESNDLFAQLRKSIPWQQDYFRIAGQAVAVPRLQAWFGDEGARYAYSGLSFDPTPWLPALLHIRARVEEIAGCSFNSVLTNLYRDENDSVGWHADDEPELGQQPVIASASFGASRRFQLQHLSKKKLKFEITLQHGDVLIMTGALQQFWRHQVPKEKVPTAARINLTYRQILAAVR